MAQIHNSAIVSPQAEIAADVEVGAYSIVGAHAVIASGTRVAAHVVICAHTHIGHNNRIFQFASIGNTPQDKKYREGDKTFLDIGDNNSIREFCTLNAGTIPGTTIGNNNLLMAYVHIAHDCSVGNDTIFVNNANLGGHVRVDDHAVIGASVKVHQFCRIGEYAFTRGTMLARDLPPYVMAIGYPAKTYGVNVTGLKRAGFSTDVIAVLKICYKTLLRRTVPQSEAIQALAEYSKQYPEVQKFVDFVQTSSRGVLVATRAGSVDEC